MDNQEAQLKVAQEVPFITGSFTNTGSATNGAINPFQTVQRQEVGTILKVTPQINDGNSVMLKIEPRKLERRGDLGFDASTSSPTSARSPRTS